MADRKNWYFDQRVTQAELDDSYNDLEQADFAIVRDILGFGFLLSAPNPATVVESGVPNNLVQINPLLGYDQLGRRLANDIAGFAGAVDLGVAPQSLNMLVDENGTPTDVVTPGNEKTLTIFVEFRRKLSDSRLDGNGATVFFEQEETVQFNVVQSAEAPLGTSVPTPARPDQLILADVVRINGQTVFLNADIDQSRRDNFILNLVHGGTHVEGGADPIPNATGAVGGLMSAADKTRFDALMDGVPVGTVISWFRPTTGTAIPPKWVVCDGSVIANPLSPFDTLAVPDLADKFIRGYSGALGSYPPATTGGSDTHSHTINNTVIGNFTNFAGGAQLGLNVDPHSHTETTVANIPEYVGLLQIIKILD